MVPVGTVIHFACNFFGPMPWVLTFLPAMMCDAKTGVCCGYHTQLLLMLVFVLSAMVDLSLLLDSEDPPPMI